MKRFLSKLLVSSAVLLGCLPLLTAQPADPNAPLQNDPAVRYGKLENGLTYYIRHNAKPENRAEFYFVADVGAIQESPAQDGLAHFLEHMALNGSKNLPGKTMLDYFRTIGVEFGRNINAATGVEMTSYMLNNIPVHRQGIIDTALLVMHDYCAFVTNADEEINKERGVIVEEWRTRRNADWRMHEEEIKYIFRGSKYATCTLIGSKENLETFDPQELRNFYATWYRPDLQAIIVVGDIDVDAIEAQIKSRFADLPVPATPNPKTMHAIPDNDTPIVAVLTDPEATNTSATVFFKSQPLPKAMNNLGAAYLNDMIESLVSAIFNERLSDISRMPDAPFIQAGGGFGSICTTSDAMIGTVFTRDGEIMPGFRSLMTEFEKLKRFGVTESELQRAKENMLSRLERNKNRAESRQNGELVYPLINHFTANSPYMDPAYEYEVAKGYAGLLTAQVINMGLSQMNLEHNAVIIYKAPEREGLTHPTEADFIQAMADARNADLQAAGEDELPDQLMDASQLKGSPVKKVSEDRFGSTVWTLKNGIRVHLKHTDFNQEEILFNLSIPGGRSQVEDNELASIEDNYRQLAMSTGGLSDFPSTTLSKMLTGKMVSCNPYISATRHGFSGASVPKDLETAFQVIYLMAAEPRFVPEEMEVGLNQLRTLLPNILKQPDFIYQQAVNEAVYGDNPRQRTISEALLAEADLKTMETVYRRLFSNAKGATLTIIGNFDEATLRPLVEKYIGSLPTARKPFRNEYRDGSYLPGEIVRTIEVPMTTEKTTVGFFLHADNMPYNLKNSLIRNAFTYILDLVYTESIREEEGGTYGVQSSVSFDRDLNNAELTVYFDTDPDKAGRLIELARQGLQQIAREGVTAEQLAKATENMLKNVPESRISNNYWSSCMINWNLYGTDLDTGREEAIRALTPEDIRAFAAAFVDSGNFIEVIMNPAK